jgi:hypothetical protein
MYPKAVTCILMRYTDPKENVIDPNVGRYDQIWVHGSQCNITDLNVVHDISRGMVHGSQYKTPLIVVGLISLLLLGDAHQAFSSNNFKTQVNFYKLPKFYHGKTHLPLLHVTIPRTRCIS